MVMHTYLHCFPLSLYTAETWHDVLVEYVDIVSPVGPRVFVPESDHVTQFVDDNSEFVAVFADRDRLRPAATLADERTAPTSTFTTSE